jgi:hypothetical protein
VQKWIGRRNASISLTGMYFSGQLMNDAVGRFGQGKDRIRFAKRQNVV